MGRTAATAKLRLELIVETGRILATTPDTAAALRRVAAHIVPAGADCFLLCLFRKEDRLPFVRMQHIDGERAPMMLQSTQSLLSSPDPNVDRAAKVRFAREIATYGEDGHASARLLEILGMTNGVTVVIKSAGRPCGLLVLATQARRRGAAANVDFGRALSDAIGLALQKSSLTKQTQRAVKACEGALNIVSHDLRNPLSTIQICARALLDPPPTPLNGMRDMAEIIQRSASWMETILQDLVDRANLEAGHLALERKKIGVGDLLAAAQVMFTPIAQERSIHFVVQGSAELPVISGDPNRILQVLSNLLGNALKFTPTSGSVVLSAQLDLGASPDSSWRRGDVRFAVSDTGPGIPDQDLDHIFDWFWQSAQRSRGSAGLGLAIAKGLVEAHGRRLHVQSAPGQGSTFWFTMPSG